MTLVRAYTGPTRLNQDQVELIETTIVEFDPPDFVRTGCAIGTDTVAGILNIMEYPEAGHKLYVPAAYHNEKFVKWVMMDHREVEIIHCPERESAASSYRRRNEMMVHGSTELVAFVYHEEFYRSGEWMTINIARREAIPVTIYKIGARP